MQLEILCKPCSRTANICGKQAQVY